MTSTPVCGSWKREKQKEILAQNDVFRFPDHTSRNDTSGHRADVTAFVLMQKTNSLAILDAKALRVTRDGVESYYWPVRHEDIRNAAVAIVDAYRSVLSVPGTMLDEDTRLACAATTVLYMDLLAIFAARLLATRCERDGRDVVMPKAGAPEWRSAFLGEPLGGIRQFKILPYGVRRPPSWRRFIRPLGDIGRPQFYRRCPIEFASMTDDIISVSPSPLTQKYANKMGVRQTFTPLYEWFYPASPDELRRDPLKPMSVDIRDRLVGALEKAFHSLGAGPARVPVGTIEALFDDSTSWVRFYLRRIERNPKRLPKRLWRGSSGIPWARMLGDAVLAHGGHVVSFDHAYGANYSETTIIPFSELQATDVFVTYTKAHADLYRRVGPKLLIGTSMPDIEYIGETAAVSHILPTASVREVKNLLYVPSHLSDSRMAAIPHMPPAMAFDWQARLLAMLQDMGLKVSQKPHPDSILPTSSVFERELGVPKLSQRFEEIMNDYDIVLFDFAPQTCFGVTLRSDVPMVLIDFGGTTYRPELKAMLERRCAVVPGWFDENNRAQVDRQALADAIQRARFLRDPSFAEAIVAL
jgi:hypothetical protein